MNGELKVADQIKTCPIWGPRYEAEGNYDPEEQVYDVKKSQRAYTGYKIEERLLDRFVNRWYL